MVATSKLNYTGTSMGGCSSSQDQCIPRTLTKQHYSPDVTATLIHAHAEQSFDEVTFSSIATMLIRQADRVFPGGFVKGEPGHTAEYFEDGMQQIMIMGNDYEAMRVVLREGDPELEPTMSEDIDVASTQENGVAVMPSVKPEVTFSSQWVKMLFIVLSAVIRSRELKVLLKRYARSRDGRAAYLRVLNTLEAKYCGATGRSVVLQELTTRALVGKTHPAVMFDKIRSLWMRYNRMSANGINNEAVASVAIGAVYRNSLYRNFIQTQHDLDNITFEDFESRTIRFFLQHVRYMPDDGRSVLSFADIADALDKAFVIAADQFCCPFCKGPPVYHKFKECPALASLMREGSAYNRGN